MLGQALLLLATTSAASGAERAAGTYALRGSSSGATVVATTGSTAWVASAVEARVRPLAGTAGSIGLVMHQQDAANHYLFLVSTKSTALMIYRNVGGNYTLLGQTPHLTLGEMIGNEYALRGEADGAGNLTILWDGVPRLTVTDTTFASGSAGLRAWSMTADFDDVRVEDAGGATLLYDDFEDGDAAGWNAGSAWSVVSNGGGGMAMPPPMFDTGFDGGNGEVTFVDLPNWTVHLRPELKGSSPYRAWFYFKVSNLSDARETRFTFPGTSFFTQPWYSYDDEHWSALPALGGGLFGTTFSEDEVWIAHSIPYDTRHQDRLIDDLTRAPRPVTLRAFLGPRVRVTTLATSEGGRAIPLIEITAPAAGPAELAARRGIWILGRQHAWEASGSWMVDGLARWLVSSDPRADALLERARVFLVPIVDVDSVVLGASGKDQAPIDFNRDWRAAPHWNAVRAAARATAAQAAHGSYDLFIDSHCPGSSTTFLAVQPQIMVSVEYWQRFQALRAAFVQTAQASSHPYTGAVSEWGPSYHPLWYQMSFWHQYTTHPELKLSITLETATGSAVGYRQLSRALGRALNGWFP